MSRRCPNCDQRLLADESVCWQCGAQVQPLAADAPVATAGKIAANWHSDPLVVYGAVTALVVLVVLLLTAYLGARPLAQTPVGNPPGGWVVAGDPARQFVLFLPEEWSQHTMLDETLVQALDRHVFYTQGLAPLVEYVEDAKVVFLATGALPSTFLVVARSGRLNRLSTADAVLLAREGDDRVINASEIEGPQGMSQAAFVIALQMDDAENLNCRQRFLRGIDAALLFSLCSSASGMQEEAANTILSSIRRLE